METVLSSLEALDIAVARFLERNSAGAVVGLSGELGAGKTTFVRSAVRHLARGAKIAEPRVTSPTFVLHQSYGNFPVPVEHFDLYRLEKADRHALVEIGYFEAIERCRAGRGFAFVEWPERAVDVASLLLDRQLWMGFRCENRVLRDALEAGAAIPEK